jgi:uncharacterized membrane protein YqaE (UPF0057 family)
VSGGGRHATDLLWSHPDIATRKQVARMRYLIAILLPPLGMLTAHRPGQALLCLLLMVTLIGWPIAAIWALLVVHNYYADRRTDRLIEAQKRKR